MIKVENTAVPIEESLCETQINRIPISFLQDFYKIKDTSDTIVHKEELFLIQSVSI